jgi:hypothetical protein
LDAFADSETRTSASLTAIDTVPADADDNRALECAVSAGSQTRSLDDDVLGTNPKYDWKRFGDFISTLGEISSAALV